MLSTSLKILSSYLASKGLILEGLKVESMPDYCNLKPDCINMNGKKLDAFQVRIN